MTRPRWPHRAWFDGAPIIGVESPGTTPGHSTPLAGSLHAHVAITAGATALVAAGKGAASSRRPTSRGGVLAVASPVGPLRSRPISVVAAAVITTTTTACIAPYRPAVASAPTHSAPPTIASATALPPPAICAPPSTRASPARGFGPLGPIGRT
jgi:hypothetical protein